MIVVKSLSQTDLVSFLNGSTVTTGTAGTNLIHSSTFTDSSKDFGSSGVGVQQGDVLNIIGGIGSFIVQATPSPGATSITLASQINQATSAQKYSITRGGVPHNQIVSLSTDGSGQHVVAYHETRPETTTQVPFAITQELNWSSNGFQAVELLDLGAAGFIKGLKARLDPTSNGGGSATLQVWIAQAATAPTSAPADEDVFVRKTSISLGAGHATDAVYVDTFGGEGAPYSKQKAKLFLVASLTGSTGNTKVTFLALGRK